MNTDTTIRSVDFYFESNTSTSTSTQYWDAVNANVAYVEKKLTRLINNWGANASYFFTLTSETHVSAVVTFQYGVCDTDAKDENKIDANLTRVINSHKESATFNWPSPVRQTPKAGK